MADDVRQESLAGGVYRICRRIGGGGEGDVYLVQHIPTEQMRAAKVIKSEEPNRQMHELHMLKHLHHPSLPQIIDVFQWEGQVWLIMEYIQGRALSELQGRDMTGDQFFQIARELAEVLIYLHSRENPILHLDIKPSNVLVKRDGHPALIDFGASVLSRGGKGFGARLGTRGFSAPEQMEGAGGDVDERADIYGFGATMYYCLHGKKPGGPAALLYAPPPRRPLRMCRSDTGGGKREAYWRRQAGIILGKCLQEERSRRYPDFVLLYRDICRAEKRYFRRKRLGGISAAAAFFLLVLIFAAGTLPSGYPDGLARERDQGHSGSAAQETGQKYPDGLAQENGQSHSDGLTQEAAQRYERLLEMASGLGLAQALSFYEEAAQIYPAGEWGILVLERLSEDYLFTVEEEGILKELIYKEVPGMGETAAEVMRQQPEVYGEFSYRLGLAYWYFYQDAGGKRAAASWFDQAIRSQEVLERPASWLEAARIHADIGGYYEKLGRQDEEGKRRADFQTYWDDLKRLLELDSFREESAGIRRQVVSEILSCLIMGACEVQQSGESLETIRQILNELSEAVQDEQLWPEQTQREAAAGQYRDAAAAVERVFADERGLEIEGEQEFQKEQESAE